MITTKLSKSSVLALLAAGMAAAPRGGLKLMLRL